MKRAFCCILGLVLVGCATQSWVGRDASILLAKLGEPQATVDLGGNGRLLVYQNRKSGAYANSKRDVCPQSGCQETSTSTLQRFYYVSREFAVDTAGRIRDERLFSGICDYKRQLKNSSDPVNSRRNFGPELRPSPSLAGAVECFFSLPTAIEQ